MKIKNMNLFLVAIVVISLIAALVYAQGLQRGNLQSMTVASKNMFKTMVQNFFSPVIHGWGIGYDCDSDDYVTAKFYIINVRNLARNRVTEIIRNARQTNVTDWSTVRDRIQNALENEGTEIKKGRISIDGENFVLTNIQTGDTLSADIREIPDYTSCKTENVTADDCELNAEKVGDITITKRAGIELPGEPKAWGGTLNFKEVSYKFVALAYPRS
jgi:hypothetical protein